MSSVKNHFLDLFFYPESVAVVGASRNERSANFHLVSNPVRLGFPGKIYPVNPSAEEIAGLKAYPDLASIEGDIDLVVIAVPVNLVFDIVKDCIAKKVKGVTIIAGGFSESGARGRGAQDEMLSLLRENGIRAIGPNALSPVNSANNFIVSFGAVDRLPKGGLAFVFQSGLYEPRLNWFFSDLHLSLSKLLDLGNKMDINEVDALEYLAQDEDTTVIAMHMESIAGDARKFMQLLKDTTKEKPVIILKSGRTAAGARAASSHTGALVQSSDAVFDGVLKQAGAVRAQGLDEFFDLAKIFEYLPPLKRNRIGIANFSGGEGVIATDFCQFNGLSLAELSPETRSKVRSVFPSWEIPVNPFDMGVSAQFHNATNVYQVVLGALNEDPNVDCLAIQIGGFFPGDLDQLVKLLSEVIGKGKPLVTWLMNTGRGRDMVEQLESNRIPVYASAERAVRALGALYRYGGMRERL